MKKLINNRRANIPVTILVIGVLLICALTIFSFSFSISKNKKTFSDIFVIEKIKVQKEKIAFYENIGIESDILSLGDDFKGKYLNESEGDISVRYYLD